MNTLPVIVYCGDTYLVDRDCLMLRNTNNSLLDFFFENEEELDDFVESQFYEVEGLRLVA